MGRPIKKSDTAVVYAESIRPADDNAQPLLHDERYGKTNLSTMQAAITMSAFASVSATVLATSGGDRGVKAIVFWGLIILIAGGITFAIRRSRTKRIRNHASDDWQPNSGQAEHEGRSRWR